MTESDYTAELVKKLKVQVKRGLVLKHCDRYTKGIPDLTVTWHGLTTWFEAKHLPNTQVGSNGDARLCVTIRPDPDVPAVQWETLRLLERGYLIAYTSRGHAVIHVAGFRESVKTLRLLLVPTIDELARHVLLISQANPKSSSGEW